MGNLSGKLEDYLANEYAEALVGAMPAIARQMSEPCELLDLKEQLRDTEKELRDAKRKLRLARRKLYAHKSGLL